MGSEKRFPLLVIQKDLDAGIPRTIPWSLAERAYADYSRRYGTDQSLERLAQRGGFGPTELDVHVPGWRDELKQANAAAVGRGGRGMTEPKAEYRDGVNSKRGMTALECLMLLDQYLPGRHFTLAPDVFDCLHGDLQTARHAASEWKAGVVNGKRTLTLVKGNITIQAVRGEES